MARNGSWLTRSYNFITKDPEIDVFRTIYQKEHIKESDLAVLAGLSVSTVKNMFGGETRRPQHATFAKMAGAMGYKYGLQREDAPDYEAELPKARQEFKAYKDHLKKKRERERAKGRSK
jgi:transcriptional regulator with XRE-family HTH domain